MQFIVNVFFENFVFANNGHKRTSPIDSEPRFKRFCFAGLSRVYLHKQAIIWLL